MNQLVPCRPIRLTRATTCWLILLGCIGLTASIVLTIEHIHLLANPHYVPSCNINPILSCGSLMATPQAHILGFPNSAIGIVGFGFIIIITLLTVWTTQIPPWCWKITMLGLISAVGFVHWLIFESLYKIGSLCPYCMIVWAITIPLCTLTTGIVGQHYWHSRMCIVLYQWRWTITILWYCAVLSLIWVRFESYWLTLIP